MRAPYRDRDGLTFPRPRQSRSLRRNDPYGALTAGDSAWLSFIEHQHVASCSVISHIRRATTGDISLANTQPLTRELGGRMHVFAHNGRVDGIEHHHYNGQQRFSPARRTDSGPGRRNALIKSSSKASAERAHRVFGPPKEASNLFIFDPAFQQPRPSEAIARPQLD